MKYLFNDFMFDSEQLILYKNNEIISCRHNEAKLLALFLTDPKRIFSKDDILEQVWSGKVVSEQAVFQNISVLRALIGEGSIKTFSKKGYQWQLDVRPYVDMEGNVSLDSNANPVPPIASEEKTSKEYKPRWIFALTAIVVFVVIGAIANYFDETPQRPRVALLPLLTEPNDVQSKSDQTLLKELIRKSLLHSESYVPVAVDNVKDHQDFFYAPQKYVSSLRQQTNKDVVMVASVGMVNKQITLRYLLKSKNGRWAASHTAADPKSLLEAFNKHIELIMASDLLAMDEFDSNLINARLKILHQQAPDDSVILAALANSEIRQGNSSHALVLTETLVAKAKSEQDATSEGSAYVIAAQAYIAQSLYAEASAALHKASEVYTALHDYRSLASVQQTDASMAFAKQDYASFKDSLVKGIEFARQANEPLLEVNLASYLSVIANKFGNKEDRQFYLDQAELVLDRTAQSREHYGNIYFYAGMYAESNEAAEKLYRKVLAILPADQDWWERDRAREHLTQLLIDQSRWNEALQLYATNKLHPTANVEPIETLDAAEELMVSKIHAARQDWPQAEAHGLSAFKKANLSGQKHYAMDASLALLNIYAAANQSEKMPTYKQSIINEAENYSYWIKVNQANLNKFSITIP